MKKITLLLAFALAILGAKADDFGLWSEVGISQNLGVRGLSAELGYDIRLADHWKDVGRRSFNVGLNYSVTRFLKVGASYAYGRDSIAPIHTGATKTALSFTSSWKRISGA